MNSADQIANQDRERLEDYLNWYEEYPNSDPENSFSLVSFLMAAECDQPLTGLVPGFVEHRHFSVLEATSEVGAGDIFLG